MIGALIAVLAAASITWAVDTIEQMQAGKRRMTDEQVVKAIISKARKRGANAYNKVAEALQSSPQLYAMSPAVREVVNNSRRNALAKANKTQEKINNLNEQVSQVEDSLAQYQSTNEGYRSSNIGAADLNRIKGQAEAVANLAQEVEQSAK